MKKRKVLTRVAAFVGAVGVFGVSSSMVQEMNVVDQVSLHENVNYEGRGSGRNRANGNFIERKVDCSAWFKSVADNVDTQVCAEANDAPEDSEQK